MARTVKGNRADAINRRRIAEKYLDVAELVADEVNPESNNVTVGIAVLAGIAASDATCLVARGERSNQANHDAAVALLEKVDPNLASVLRKLLAFKPPAHYGTTLIGDADRVRALRAARTLVTEARRRTS
jgi:hypothetical protein